MSSQEKRRNDHKTFGDLPPRVIVHEILCHHPLPSLKPEDYQPRTTLRHFGYFTRDRFRNIWYMFERAMVEKEMRDILNFRRIAFLDVSSPTQEFLSKLKSASPKMRSLRRLEIRYGDFSTLFSKENCFPNLHSLSFHTVERVLENDFVVCPNTNVFQRIKSLRFISWRNSLNDALSTVTKKNETTIFSNLTNLELLHLAGIRFENPFHLKLPKLKKIRLSNVNILSITRCDERIEDIDIRSSREDRLFEDFYKRCRNIRILNARCYLAADDSYLNPLLFNPSWNPLHSLRKLTLYGLNNFSGLPGSCFGENIECLAVYFCSGLSEHLFSDREYKKLTKIIINDFPAMPTKEWKILKNVEYLKIQHVNAEFFDDNGELSDFIGELFRLNKDFLSKKLEELYFEFCNLEDSTLEKTALKSLRKLGFEGCDDFDGSGLKRENLERLEHLFVDRLTCNIDTKMIRKTFPNVNLGTM